MDSREELKKSEQQMPQAGGKHGLFAGDILISGEKLPQFPTTTEKVNLTKPFNPVPGRWIRGDDSRTLGDPDGPHAIGHPDDPRTNQMKRSL